MCNETHESEDEFDSDKFTAIGVSGGLSQDDMASIQGMIENIVDNAVSNIPYISFQQNNPYMFGLPIQYPLDGEGPIQIRTNYIIQITDGIERNDSIGIVFNNYDANLYKNGMLFRINITSNAYAANFTIGSIAEAGYDDSDVTIIVSEEIQPNLQYIYIIGCLGVDSITGRPIFDIVDRRTIG